jgi:hypothetical protein
VCRIRDELETRSVVVDADELTDPLGHGDGKDSEQTECVVYGWVMLVS